jgi:hypothetical protein
VSVPERRSGSFLADPAVPTVKAKPEQPTVRLRHSFAAFSAVSVVPWTPSHGQALDVRPRPSAGSRYRPRGLLHEQHSSVAVYIAAAVSCPRLSAGARAASPTMREGRQGRSIGPVDGRRSRPLEPVDIGHRMVTE